MPVTIEQCRLHHLQRQARHTEPLEQKRQRILAGIHQVANIARQFGAEQTYIFGSVLEGIKFHDRSDLDILVVGMPLPRWLSALLAIEKIPTYSDVVIDLKRAEELPEWLVTLFKSHGKRIQIREETSTYIANYDGKKNDIGAQNTYYLDNYY